MVNVYRRDLFTKVGFHAKANGFDKAYIKLDKFTK